MKQKILAILGSPHPKGTTATMLSHLVWGAKQAGHDVQEIHLYKKQIQYCLGCQQCAKTKRCVIEDDMGEITKLIKECDVVIMAAPVYWGNVPAVVKNMFDRLFGVAMEETKTFPKPLLSGKRYILVTACHTAAPFAWIFGQSRGAIHAMNEFFKTAGMKRMHKFVMTNTKHHHDLPTAMVKKLRNVFHNH